MVSCPRFAGSSTDFVSVTRGAYHQVMLALDRRFRVPPRIFLDKLKFYFSYER